MLVESPNATMLAPNELALIGSNLIALRSTRLADPCKAPTDRIRYADVGNLGPAGKGIASERPIDPYCHPLLRRTRFAYSGRGHRVVRRGAGRTQSSCAGPDGRGNSERRDARKCA